MRAQVHADLVRAAGGDGHVQRATRRAGTRDAGDARHRRPRVPARAARHLLPVARVAADGRVDAAARLHQRPRRARRTPSRPRGRGTAARAPGARRRAWRPPSRPTCRGRGDARCPGRSSPPMPLRSSTWCSSALTSVPSAWPGAGCTTMPGGLFTTMRSASSKRTSSGSASGSGVAGAGSGTSTRDRVAGARRRFACAARPPTETWPSLISRWICEREWPGSCADEELVEALPACSASTVSLERVHGPVTGHAALRRRRAPARRRRSAPASGAARQHEQHDEASGTRSHRDELRGREAPRQPRADRRGRTR